MSDLKIENLSASYGDKIVLFDVSFSLQQGEFICLCGPNGAGKSTLLSVMAGVPDAALKVSGGGDQMAAFSKLPRREAARLIAYLQQNEYSEWDFIVRDYVLQGRYAYTKRTLFGAGPANYTRVDYEVVDGVLQHILSAIGQQNLLFGNTVDLADADRDDTLFALIVDAGIEAQILGVEVLHSVKHLLAWLEIEFVSIKIIHCVLFCFSLQRYEKTKEEPN